MNILDLMLSRFGYILLVKDYNFYIILLYGNGFGVYFMCVDLCNVDISNY